MSASVIDLEVVRKRRKLQTFLAIFEASGQAKRSPSMKRAVEAGIAQTYTTQNLDEDSVYLLAETCRLLHPEAYFIREVR